MLCGLLNRTSDGQYEKRFSKLFVLLSEIYQVTVDSHYTFQDIASVMAVTGCYSTTEPLIDAQCDIYIQKIGPNYRAYMYATLCIILLRMAVVGVRPLY